MTSVPQPADILASLGQASFVWDIGSDRLTWSENTPAVFADIPAESLASGAEFAKLIEPARSIRQDALTHAPGRPDEGVPYRIEYGVRATTAVPVIWVEEAGIWFAGSDGRPWRAQGVVRVNNSATRATSSS